MDDLLEIIDNIKTKIRDCDYKKIMESLAVINEDKKPLYKFTYLEYNKKLEEEEKDLTNNFNITYEKKTCLINDFDYDYESLNNFNIDNFGESCIIIDGKLEINRGNSIVILPDWVTSKTNYNVFTPEILFGKIELIE